MSTRNKEYLELLEHSFNEEKYIKFVIDLLNLDISSLNRNIIEISITQNQYKDSIDYYKFVANYNDGMNNIGVFIIKLNNTSSTRARNMQRNFVATLLQKYNLDGALVSFFSDKEKTWRLSFVKKELSFTENGVKETLTSAKRYSYLVGEGESTHTAKEFLLHLLDIDNRKITLSDIEKQFDVEKVTKRFFEEYKEKYLQLKEFLDKNEDFQTEAKNCDFNSEEFAKKLMGQIVFLYFLQKKGWLGVQLIPNELSKEEYNDLLSQNDSVSQNLIKNYYELVENKYIVERTKLRLLETQEDIINLTNIFKGTKYDMPWGSGKKDFIMHIFNQSQKEHKNFFDDYLEYFFYKGLNEKRENQYFPLFNCKIPFLNGGLFEPLNNYRWSSAHFEIKNSLFHNDNEDGILDFLNLYNFTIDEEEPLEKEIAVDPEMLGKIFENLLEIGDRKDKGAFYTPREIVHYMCQESLANYLCNNVNVDYNEINQFIKYGDIISQYDWDLSLDEESDFVIGKSIYNNLLEIDNALINVKIADPAVGSGAFPLGMLNEIVKLRTNIQTYLLIQKELGLISLENLYSTEHLETDIYKMKLQTIENCIYAVDIETSAVDIAKLRLWLSLVVDYPSDKEPRPLPNLDCKIMQGNSLIDEFENVPLFSEKMLESNLKGYHRNESQLSSVADVHIQQTLFDDTAQINEYIDKMLELQKEYFRTSDNKVKKDLKEKIEAIQMGMVEESLRGTPSKLNRFKEISKKKQKPWFIWKLEFYDVFKNNGGFDIVIGNPPYIKEGKNSDVFKGLKNNKYYKGKMDFWYFFACIGIDLLVNKGTLCYIAPNNWITSYGASIMRNKVLSETTIKQFIDFNNYMVFDSASIQTMIMLLSKEKSKRYFVDYRKVDSVDFDKTDLEQLLKLNNKKKKFINEIIDFVPSNYLNEYIRFSYGTDGNLINKIKNKGNYYITKDDISQGIVMPQDRLNLKNANKLGNGFNKDDGIFVINNNEKKNLNLTDIENEIIKPYYTSSNIHKYWFDSNNNEWVIYTNKKAINSINKYPNIKNHLEKYKSIITSDNKPYGLHRPRDNYFFEGEKIICYRKCIEPTFSYNDTSSYVSQTYNIIKTNSINLKYLCALLNSSLIKFWFKKCGKLQGNNYQLDSEPLMKVPIYYIESEQTQRITELFDAIYVKHDNCEDIIKEIDDVVYKLYEISDEERKYIEYSINE
jgi:adenine-specific DNA-methyltransferase